MKVLNAGLYFFILFLFPLHAISSQPTNKVKIMSINLYIGVDTASTYLTKAWKIPLTVRKLFEGIKKSSFSSRAKALASFIREKNPDLIGLQEVSLIKLQRPGDFFNPPKPPTQKVYLDYLTILMDTLKAKGLHYEVVSSNKTIDVELPMLFLLPPFFSDVRTINRDVILKKKGTTTESPQKNLFQDVVVIEKGNSSIRVSRGYCSVITTLGGQKFKFVTTHLETLEEELPNTPQSLQAKELAENLNEELAEDDLPIIIAGDLNSHPNHPPDYPYHILTREGFDDLWEIYQDMKSTKEKGYTCCHLDLKASESTLDMRIDHILLKLPDSSRIALENITMELFGDDPNDKIEGLWPSDHTALYAELNFSQNL